MEEKLILSDCLAKSKKYKMAAEQRCKMAHCFGMAEWRSSDIY